MQDGGKRSDESAGRTADPPQGAAAPGGMTGRPEGPGRDQERSLGLIAEQISDAVITTNLHYEITYANRAFQRLYGYTAGEILGQSPDLLNAEPDSRSIQDDIYAKVSAGQPWTGELLNRRKDGSTFMCELRVFPLVDDRGVTFAFAGIQRDITERKRAEEALRFTSFAIDHVADSAFWMGRDARFFYVNDAACRSLGYSRDELLAMTVHDVDPGFPVEAWSAHWQELKAHRSLTFESHHRDKDGRVFPVEIRANFVEFEGREYNCAFARDITKRKRTEREKRALEAQIQHAQKLESLGVLAGGIAHDFNNLLMAILGNADLALMDLSPVSAARENIAEIRKASQRAADLTRQMLAYSGKGRFVIEAVDLTEVVSEMAHMLEVSVSKKAVLRYDFGDNVPAINADVTQIRQVIMNLITNASEALGHGDGIISVATGARDVDRRYLANAYLNEDLPEGLYATLEVADTGCGMDAETRSRMFDPFFTTKFTGRGLGMAAVLGIVRGHKGAITIDSEVGKGTAVRVLLPVVRGETARRPGPEADRPQTLRASGTVLLVDDEETVRAIAKAMLGKIGLDVIVARDGQEAVDLFRQRHRDIDCVILDLTMPRMDGEQTFEALRRIRPDARVIISSGYGEQEIAQRFAGRDIAGAIRKPYELHTLAAVLNQVLSGSRRS